MDYNLCRHCRIAGCLVVFVGLYLNSWPIIIIGNIASAAGFMWSIAKTERYIEGLKKEMTDETNA